MLMLCGRNGRTSSRSRAGSGGGVVCGVYFVGSAVE
jgi:hypothetical protein